jgi:hypothetical protein
MDGRSGARGFTILRVAGAVASLVVAGGVVTYLVVPLTGRALTAAVKLISSACVWFAVSISTGANLWGMLGAVGRVAANALVTPGGSAGLLVLLAIAALAAFGLQRLLGSEEESSR